MDSAALTAAVSGAVAIVVAALTAGSTYLLTKRREQEADWRKLKLDLYKEYVTALSDQLNALSATQTRYVNATNALTLVAPSIVLVALYAFNDDLFVHQAGDLAKRIQALLTALRQDIHPTLRQKRENSNLRLTRRVSAHTNDPQVPAASN